MRFILGSITALVLFSFFISCKKDKVQQAVIDPNCTDTISFNDQIAPMINTYCISCHDSGNSTGYTLTSHEGIAANAKDILDAIKEQNGKLLMPQDGPPLADSLIQQFSCWVDQGKANN